MINNIINEDKFGRCQFCIIHAEKKDKLLKVRER